MRWFISALCLCMLISSTAFAAPKEKPKKGKPADQPTLDLFAPLTSDSDTKADGNINDWNEEANKGVQVQTLLSGEYEYDWTGPKDLSANVRAQYGAERIYFLISVSDNAVVSKKKQWKSDRVELWLAPESADGKSLGATRGILMDIGPQVDGGKATIKWLSGKGGGLEGAGYIGEEGYDFEVSVDYSALSKTTPVLDGGMRYCVLVRDWDQDDPNEDEATVGTCPINPKSASSIKRDQMGKMKFNLAGAMWDQILANDRQLGADGAEWAKLSVNIAGTAMPETIAFAGDTLLVAGFGLNGYDNLSWSKITLESGFQMEAPKLEVKDIDSDKEQEILLTRREHCTNGAMYAMRTYIFKYTPTGIRFMGSYVTEQHADSGSDFVKNTFKFGKTSFTQSLDKSSTKGMPACELNGSNDMGPVITHESEEKSVTLSYL